MTKGLTHPTFAFPYRNELLNDAAILIRPLCGHLPLSLCRKGKAVSIVVFYLRRIVRNLFTRRVDRVIFAVHKLAERYELKPFCA